MREAGFSKEMNAQAVAISPALKILRPRIGLPAGQKRWVGDKCPKNPRFKDSRSPEFFSQLMVTTDAFGNRSQLNRRNAQHFFANNPKARHPRHIHRIGEVLQFSQNGGDIR